MISIDSQIWIYYWYPKAKEHSTVKNWIEGSKNDGIIHKELVILSVIIPLEIGHNLYKIAKSSKILDVESVSNILFSLISNENVKIIDIDSILLVDALQKMKNYSILGIGGRDTLILATMDKFGLKTIATHDKNTLALDEYKRIDPVFNPPLIFEEGEKFDEILFKQRLKEL
ncbi:MAG: type II toxin-antitoxin system VapC family toxin [Promethearchaeota archaeon]